MREKLIELLRSVQYQGNAVHGYHDKYIQNSELADYLIANGVTIQRFIPVSEGLPDKDGRYLVYDCDTGNYYDSYFDETEGEFGEWQMCFDPSTLGAIDSEWNSCPNVTHWMLLPLPPKEGE